MLPIVSYNKETAVINLPGMPIRKKREAEVASRTDGPVAGGIRGKLILCGKIVLRRCAD